MAAKEKIEQELAVQNVQEADRKVADLKAEKVAKKAEKHQKRLDKHPKLGKVVNWVDDNKLPVGVGVLIGGPLGVGAVLGYQKIKGKKSAKDTEVIDDDTSDEVVETPFEA